MGQRMAFSAFRFSSQPLLSTYTNYGIEVGYDSVAGLGKLIIDIIVSFHLFLHRLYNGIYCMKQRPAMKLFMPLIFGLEYVSCIAEQNQK